MIKDRMFAGTTPLSVGFKSLRGHPDKDSNVFPNVFGEIDQDSAEN